MGKKIWQKKKMDFDWWIFMNIIMKLISMAERWHARDRKLWVVITWGVLELAKMQNGGLGNLLGSDPGPKWLRLTLLCSQHSDLCGLPAIYLKKNWVDLNSKQLRKVQRVLDGRQKLFCSGYTAELMFCDTELSAEDRLFVSEGPTVAGSVESGQATSSARDIQKWNMNENIRLALCLFETFHEGGGVTFLSFFRERRGRVNLDLDEGVAEEQLTKVFNDPTKRWSYPEIEAIAKFDPHSQICMTRSAVDVSRRVAFLRGEVQEWSEAFTRSGERGIVEWDWSVHPIAEVIYKVDPSAVQCMTSCVVSGGLPPQMAEIGLPRHDQDDMSEITESVDDQTELCSSHSRTSCPSSSSRKRKRVPRENVQPAEEERFDRLANSLEVFASSINRLAESLVSRQSQTESSAEAMIATRI